MMYETELDNRLFESEDPLFFGEPEDPFLGGLGSLITKGLGGLLGEEEDGLFEDHWAYELPLGEELEAETAAALMEVLAGQVAEAESEDEADNFLPVLAALAPLALKAAAPLVAKVAPMAAKVASQVVPNLARGVMQLGKQMISSPTARSAIRTLPTIARNTAAQVLQTHAQGRPINRQTVTRALAQQTARVLRTPVYRRRCIARAKRISSMANQRLHAAASSP